MEARKNPEYLGKLAEAVEQFRAALMEFLELHATNGEDGVLGSGVARGIAPAVFPLADADRAEIARRATVVSQMAGRAAAAVPLTGVLIGVQGVARPVDPSPPGSP